MNRSYIFVLDDNIPPDPRILVDDAVTTSANRMHVVMLESHSCKSTPVHPEALNSNYD